MRTFAAAPGRSGKSSHWESGFAAALGKPVIILAHDAAEAETAYCGAAAVATDIPSLLTILNKISVKEATMVTRYSQFVQQYTADRIDPNICIDSHNDSLMARMVSGESRRDYDARVAATEKRAIADAIEQAGDDAVALATIARNLRTIADALQS
jgi:nucleoside 2-deoxyribosyltransferase